MKTATPHTDDEALWAYVHGELSASDRAAFEQRMATDRALRVACARALHLDRTLHAMLPALDRLEDSHERLAEQALAAWERDQEGAGAACPSLPSPACRARRRFFSPPTARLAGLAAAALLIIASYPLFRAPPQQTQWTRPEFAPLTFRGGDAAPPQSATLDARAARQAQAALADALTRAMADRGATFPVGLTLSLHLRELPNGTLSITVRARTTDGRSLGNWVGDYSTMARFLAHVDASASRLADALAALPTETDHPAVPPAGQTEE